MNSADFYTPLPKNILYFQQLTRDSIYPWSHTGKSWTHPTSLFSWLTSETKRWNLGLTLHPPSLTKTRNTKDGIFAGPKQDFLLHTNTTYPQTIKALQTTKIAKLGFGFNIRFTISELKSKFIFTPPRNQLGQLDLKSGLLTISPLTYA